ncbi:BCL-6 corepressor-like [Limulus polyphemus]|uniref:BCL-6 corepressor-like n=1 Tax=Limulus polyphemus TaxID=6850 RepID=A0ABM1TDP5_LIMPO|nr:BCL-6 corepressor-like [Limulus polyphemus]
MKRLVVNKALGETILHRAARLGYMEVVLYCLETNYCDVNARDNAGYTPLHECCSRGNLEIANALVLFGSDVSASAVGGIRPLHDAVENDQLEIVRLLLSHGADPMIATYSGLTPIKLSKSAVMEEFLKDYMSDVTGETSYNTCINSWQFPGSAVCLDLEEVGYDIWEGLPLESENEDKDKDDFLFEVSDTPHLPTFRLQLPCNDNKVLSNCLRLNDVLRQIGLTKDEFVQFYRNIKIFSIPRHEFEGSATCRQFMAGTKLDSEDNGKATIDVLCLNSDIREVLGIELVTLR